MKLHVLFRSSDSTAINKNKSWQLLEARISKINGKPVFLRDVWPTREQCANEVERAVNPE